MMNLLCLFLFCVGVIIIIVGVLSPILHYFVKEWGEALGIGLEDAKEQYLKHKIEYFIYSLKPVWVFIVLAGCYLVQLAFSLYFKI